MLPLLLNLTDHLAVVIGGGAVGQRKASAVLSAGGRVRLVCLEPRPAERNDPLLEWRTESYCSQHLAGASLVFAAGPKALNERIVADARHRGLWVNAASDPSAGDFILPATVRRGDFLLAVGTGGAAPLLAQSIRERLEVEYDAAFGDWVSLLSEFRPLIQERIADPSKRRSLHEMLCRWRWLELLRREDKEVVRAAMLAEIDRENGGFVE
jgi:precorrin-2 dehydrogenase/sirohydrochlorin ferrochelatase